MTDIPAPDDFDARWYAERYPDVALSGLGAEAHYRRIGRMLGRSGTPGTDIAAPEQAGTDPGDDATDDLAAIAARFGEGSRHDDPPAPPPGADDPLIPRPAGLRLGAAAVAVDRPLRIADPVEAFHFPAPADRARVSAPLDLLRCLLDGRRHGLAMLSDLAVGAELEEGPDAITDLWIEGAARMGLKLGDETSRRPDGGLATAWQAAPAGGEGLRRVGCAALPVLGPMWWELALDNPFMPVLVCLEDAYGMTRDAAVIAFPSLSRGGAHAAEAALHRENGDGVRGHWRLSARLLCALERQVPAIGGIEILQATAVGPANGSEAIFDPDLGDWLERIFGLRPGMAPLPTAADDADPVFGPDEGRAWLAAAHPPRRRPGARTLRLPADQVPTFGALLAAEADFAALPEITGPFLVTDARTSRPRWSVSLPVRAMPWLSPLQPLPRAAACPFLVGGPAAGDEAAHPSEALAPMPLGIARRETAPLSQAQSLMRLAPDAPDPVLPLAPAVEGPFAIVLRLHEADRALDLIEAVRAATGGADLQVLVLSEVRAEAERFYIEAVTRLEGCVTLLPPGATLAQAALRARHEEILCLDDRVVLSDIRAIAALRAMLAGSPEIAAATCTLLREAVSGKTVELATSGGLFPARISLMAAPALVIEEPDTTETLPMATYPVLGIALDFALLRRAAILAVADEIAAAPPEQVDTAFSLAAIGAGYVHLVTSAVAAGTTAPPRARRSEMDPVGLGALRARKWDRILASVTVLKELR